MIFGQTKAAPQEPAPARTRETLAREICDLDREMGETIRAMASWHEANQDLRIMVLNGELVARVNAMAETPRELGALEAQLAEQRRRWNVLLAEYARLPVREE